MVGKSWMQELKVHSASTVRKQGGTNWHAQLMFSFLLSPGPQPLAMVRVGLPTSINLILDHSS